jgi:hypothetical protein
MNAYHIQAKIGWTNRDWKAAIRTEWNMPERIEADSLDAAKEHVKTVLKAKGYYVQDLRECPDWRNPSYQD